jgi:hypothetical protein
LPSTKNISSQKEGKKPGNQVDEKDQLAEKKRLEEEAKNNVIRARFGFGKERIEKDQTDKKV